MSEQIFSTPTDPFSEQKPFFYKNRGTMVPGWYVAEVRAGRLHQNPEGIVVKRDGKPLERLKRPGEVLTNQEQLWFHVSDIPPERRYAVKNDGELYDQLTFERLWIKAYEEYYANIDVEDVKTMPGNPRAEAIERPWAFVMKQIDPRNPDRFIPMGYDPNATLGQKTETFYSRDTGEPVAKSRREVLIESYRDTAARALMKPAEVAEVEAILNPDPLSPAPVVEDATPKGVAAEPSPIAPEPASKVVTMSCGKQLKDNRGERMHRKHCKQGCTPLED